MQYERFFPRLRYGVFLPTILIKRTTFDLLWIRSQLLSSKEQILVLEKTRNTITLGKATFSEESELSRVVKRRLPGRKYGTNVNSDQLYS